MVAKFDSVFDKSVFLTHQEREKVDTFQYTESWKHKITHRLRDLVDLLNTKKVGV